MPIHRFDRGFHTIAPSFEGRRRSAPVEMMMIAAVLLFVTLSGCFFGEAATILGLPSEEEGVAGISVSISSSFLSCTPNTNEQFSCSFGSGETDSTFGLTGYEILFLFLADPLVIQLPDNVLDVIGSFAHPASSSGALQVEGPLTSVPIDQTRSLQAEAGTALWIVAIPEAVHADIATFDGPIRNTVPASPVSFNLQVRLPVGSSSVPAKVVATALARTLEGHDYYPPIFPCVESMADVPALSLPIPAPGNRAELDLSSAASASGCAGDIFEIGRGVATSGIPVGRTGLLILTLLLTGSAVRVLRRT